MSNHGQTHVVKIKAFLNSKSESLYETSYIKGMDKKLTFTFGYISPASKIQNMPPKIPLSILPFSCFASITGMLLVTKTINLRIISIVSLFTFSL